MIVRKFINNCTFQFNFLSALLWSGFYIYTAAGRYKEFKIDASNDKRLCFRME